MLSQRVDGGWIYFIRSWLQDLYLPSDACWVHSIMGCYPVNTDLHTCSILGIPHPIVPWIPGYVGFSIERASRLSLTPPGFPRTQCESSDPLLSTTRYTTKLSVNIGVPFTPICPAPSSRDKPKRVFHKKIKFYILRQNLLFIFYTNLTFLCKINIEGFKKFQQKIKLPPVWFELTTAAITGLEFQLPYPLSHPVICWTEDPYIEVGSFLESIEHDFIRVLKFETGKEWQIGWAGKAVRILIQWYLLLWVQIPLGATLFFADTFQTPQCQYCTEMSDLCWKRKTRIKVSVVSSIPSGGGQLFAENF